MKLFIVSACIAVACLLYGCGGEEFHYVDDAEMKPGPGVFSGKDGSFTIYQKSEQPESEDAKTKEPTKQE